jgi:hypothetical protein
VEPAGVKSAAMEPTAVEPTAVEPATVKAPAAAVRCVGEIWLAENRRAEQCSSNAHKTPPFPPPGFAISHFAHRKLLCAPSRARPF